MNEVLLPEMKEIFVKVIGHEDYGINPYGEVYSFKTKKLLKQENVNGYFRVTLDGVKIYTHMLAAIMFVPNPENKTYVVHRDGNNSNNFFLNLRWATASEVQKL